MLYGFVLLRHNDRRILHIGVTTHPTAAWTIQQIREAFPFDEAPRYLLHDRDSIYGKEFSKAVKAMGITEIKDGLEKPLAKPLLRARHRHDPTGMSRPHYPVQRTASATDTEELPNLYNGSRTHSSLNKDAPNTRPIELPSVGAKIISIPHLGGLHHRYERKAACYNNQF